MRLPLLAAVAAGFIGACGLSVAMSADPPPNRARSPVTARERPASAPVVLAPLPALRRERRPVPSPAPRARAVAAAAPVAPIVAASPPVAPPPAGETVTTPPAPATQPVAAPKVPAPSPAPEFDSSEEVFDSSG